MPSPWDSLSSGRLKGTPGTDTGGSSSPWDNPGGTGKSKESTSTLGKVGRLASLATSGRADIEALTGYDINNLPGWLSTPIDVLANPVGVGSILAAIPSGGTSFAALAPRLATRAAVDVAGAVVGGKVGQLASEGAADLGAPDWLQTGVGLVGGIAAGGLTAKSINSRLPAALGAVGEGKAGVGSTRNPFAARDPLILENSEPGLTKVQQVSNFVKEGTGKGVKAHPQITPILDDVAATELEGQQQANLLKIKTIGAIEGRDDIKYGKYLNGKATLINAGGTWEPLASVAANPSRYTLTPEQLTVIKPLAREVINYKQQYARLGGHVAPPTNMEAGGFQLPKGAALEDMYPGASAGKKAEQIYDTMEEGLAAGKEYAPLEDAMHDFGIGMSKAIAGRHAANRLLQLVDTDGKPIFRTAEEMVDPTLSTAFKAAQSTKYGLETKIQDTAQELTGLRAMKQEMELQHSLTSTSRGVVEEGVAHPLDETLAQMKDRIDTLTSDHNDAQTALDDLIQQLNDHEPILASAKDTYDQALRDVIRDPFTGSIDERALPAISSRGDKMYGPKELTDVINSQLHPTGLLAKANEVTSGLNAPLRLFHTLLDISDFGRLAGSAAPTHPFDFFKGIQTGFRSAFSRDALAKDLQNIDLELAKNGINYGVRDFVRFGKMAMGNPDIDIGALSKLPSAQARSFIERTSNITQNGISSLRAHMIKTELLNIKQAGGTVGPNEVEKVVKAISLVTGTSIHTPVKGAGMFIQFPNWLQSQMEFIAHAGAGLRPGASYESKYAANAMIRMVGLGLASTYAVNALGGHKTEFQNGIPMMRIGDAKIDTFGPYGALARGMYAALAGDATALVRSRVSPLFQIGWDLGTGKTFTGDPAHFDDPTYWASIVAPYSVTSASRDQPGEITLLQGAGVRANPVSSFVKLREQAQTIMGEDWVDLSGQQKEQLKKANPELVQQLDKLTAQQAATGDPYAKTVLATQKINDSLLEQQSTLNNLYQTGQLSGTQLRDSLENITQVASTKKQQIREDYGTDKATKVPSRVQQGLNQYFDLYTLADRGILSGGVKSGVLDWDTFDKLESDLLSKLDPVQQKAIQDRYIVRNPDLQWYYENKDLIRNSGYFDSTQTVIDRMKPAIRAAVPGAETYTDIQEAYNSAQREGNQGRTLRLLALISNINAQVQPIHDRMVRTNPLLYKALVQNGYVKQSSSRPLAANIR